MNEVYKLMNDLEDLRGLLKRADSKKETEELLDMIKEVNIKLSKRLL